MTEILLKHKLLIFIMSLVLLAAVIWLLIRGDGVEKVPSRGVFVIENLEEFPAWQKEGII